LQTIIPAGGDFVLGIVYNSLRRVELFWGWFMSVQPRCPFCNRQGLSGIVAKKLSPDFGIVYCGQCGAIYGVVPLSSPLGLGVGLGPASSDAGVVAPIVSASVPSSIPETPVAPSVKQPESDLSRDQIGAASQGSLYYAFFGGSETEEDS
jgi:hypothetical protein